MDTIGVYEAKTSFSSLIERVNNGASFLVTKRGEPVAKLSPVSNEEAKRTLGVMSLPDLPDSFFEPLPDDELEFWGV